MTCPPTVLATDAVDVDGPVMMNVEKSRRSWSQIFDSQNQFNRIYVPKGSGFYINFFLLIWENYFKKFILWRPVVINKF